MTMEWDCFATLAMTMEGDCHGRIQPRNDEVRDDTKDMTIFCKPLSGEQRIV